MRTIQAPPEGYDVRVLMARRFALGEARYMPLMSARLYARLSGLSRRS